MHSPVSPIRSNSSAALVHTHDWVLRVQHSRTTLPPSMFLLFPRISVLASERIEVWRQAFGTNAANQIYGKRTSLRGAPLLCSRRSTHVYVYFPLATLPRMTTSWWPFTGLHSEPLPSSTEVHNFDQPTMWASGNDISMPPALVPPLVYLWFFWIHYIHYVLYMFSMVFVRFTLLPWVDHI